MQPIAARPNFCGGQAFEVSGRPTVGAHTAAPGKGASVSDDEPARGLAADRLHSPKRDEPASRPRALGSRIQDTESE